MIRLRPHHLLCALTFVGAGYSDAFVANFRRVLARIETGETIEIVAGPDDLCAPLVATGDAHCTLARIDASDASAVEALRSDPRLRPILAGGALDAFRVARLREAFAADTIRGACVDCSWHDLCTSVARDDFSQSLLSPETVR